jgi:hypothetical protein
MDDFYFFRAHKSLSISFSISRKSQERRFALFFADDVLFEVRGLHKQFIISLVLSLIKEEQQIFYLANGILNLSNEFGANTFKYYCYFSNNGSQFRCEEQASERAGEKENMNIRKLELDLVTYSKL